jgi:hypothetical protein
MYTTYVRFIILHSFILNINIFFSRGLILQDLTILHIANPDFLPSGNCNFWKRKQQFNNMEKLRYFRNWYAFKIHF